MMILAGYSAGRPEDKAPTELLLDSLPKDRYTVIRRESHAPGDYYTLLADHWGKADFINIEHDNAPTLEMLDKLVGCNFPICVQAYQKHFPERDEIMHRKSINPVPDKAYAWLQEGEEWADRWGLGVAKITKEAQDLVDFSKIPDYWMNIDNHLSKAYEAIGIRAHVHWPVSAHNHHDL